MTQADFIFLCCKMKEKMYTVRFTEISENYKTEMAFWCIFVNVIKFNRIRQKTTKWLSHFPLIEYQSKILENNVM